MDASVGAPLGSVSAASVQVGLRHGYVPVITFEEYEEAMLTTV
jgi:hypothetical protein